MGLFEYNYYIGTGGNASVDEYRTIYRPDLDDPEEAHIVPFDQGIVGGLKGDIAAEHLTLIFDSAELIPCGETTVLLQDCSATVMWEAATGQQGQDSVTIDGIDGEQPWIHWELGPGITQAPGKVKFAVRVYKRDEDHLVFNWSTYIYTFTIHEGLNIPFDEITLDPEQFGLANYPSPDMDLGPITTTELWLNVANRGLFTDAEYVNEFNNQVVAIQYDYNAVCIHFNFSDYDATDVSIKLVQYLTANGESGISVLDGNNTWWLQGLATRDAGDLKFCLRFVHINDDDIVDFNISSKTYTGKILPSFGIVENDDVLKQYQMLVGDDGVSDYDALSNRPSINNILLTGNKTTADLQINDIFWAEYGVTSYAAIMAALAQHKLPVCPYDDHWFIYRSIVNNQITFVTVERRGTIVAAVDTNNNWTHTPYTFYYTATQTASYATVNQMITEQRYTVFRDTNNRYYQYIGENVLNLNGYVFMLFDGSSVRIARIASDDEGWVLSESSQLEKATVWSSPTGAAPIQILPGGINSCKLNNTTPPTQLNLTLLNFATAGAQRRDFVWNFVLCIPARKATNFTLNVDIDGQIMGSNVVIYWPNQTPPTWAANTVYELSFRCLWVKDANGAWIISAKWNEEQLI